MPTLGWSPAPEVLIMVMILSESLSTRRVDSITCGTFSPELGREGDNSAVLDCERNYLQQLNPVSRPVLRSLVPQIRVGTEGVRSHTQS
ncbi:hypothetical protein P7K49_024594 [Saguinus oedipus]|uniref:Secreted protein n=1 Tax=Saguinus oedipus TaxID=9490 RepID=A0ABQ9URL1_SAGOE|nr:hypothetical protein P7K49_024594 [Saguinus oedipus]